MKKLEEKRMELIRKAAYAKVNRNNEEVKYYMQEIEKVNDRIYGNYKTIIRNENKIENVISIAYL